MAVLGVELQRCLGRILGRTRSTALLLHLILLQMLLCSSIPLSHLRQPCIAPVSPRATSSPASEAE
jgi:hypothetical protein